MFEKLEIFKLFRYLSERELWVETISIRIEGTENFDLLRRVFPTAKLILVSEILLSIKNDGNIDT